MVKEGLTLAVELLNKLPRDIWAMSLLIGGCVLTCTGHKDEGMLVLGGALGVFKGEK